MTTETYNGWKNRATWNAHLWLTGDSEGMYHAAIDVAKDGSVEAAAEAVEEYCRECWSSETPGGYSLAQVDWNHIAEALRS